MADMADIVKQLAFYQSGGQPEGGRTIDKIGGSFDVINNTIANVLAIKKAQLQNQKASAEIPEIQAQTAKLKNENTPYVEQFGTPSVNADVEKAQNLPSESRQAAVDAANARTLDLKSKYGNLTTGQVATNAAAGLKEAQIQNLKNPKDKLSPEAIAYNATVLRKTGQMPTLGMGAASARIEIINEAARQSKDAGETGESLAWQRLSSQATQAELSNLQKNRGVISSFEKTATKNLDLAQTLSEKVDRTGVPVIDRWFLAGKKSIAGDADVAAFDAAVRTAVNEYAKVTTTASGGGVTSDTARAEIEDILNKALTKEQIRTIIPTLKQEMSNRIISFADQIGELKNQYTGGVAPSETTTTKETKSKTSSPKTTPITQSEEPPGNAKAAIRAAGGKTINFQNGQSWMWDGKSYKRVK